jgi:hypothetical protein
MRHATPPLVKQRAVPRRRWPNNNAETPNAAHARLSPRDRTSAQVPERRSFCAAASALRGVAISGH